MRTVTHNPKSIPLDIPTVSMDFVRAANRAEGGHFFDDEPALFEARVESDRAFVNVVTQDAFFVTSTCRQPGAQRQYLVRRMDEDCKVRSACNTPFASLSAAETAARQQACAA